jgi:hypothetical protein
MGGYGGVYIDDGGGGVSGNGYDGACMGGYGGVYIDGGVFGLSDDLLNCRINFGIVVGDI